MGELGEIVEQLSDRYTKLQNNVKNRKDINNLEHKLMNYIFGIEEKIANLGQQQHYNAGKQSVISMMNL